MNIYEKLMEIQNELKAPKSQYNSFGKYNYRSCEDILEAVKPLMKKYKCALTISSDIVYIEGRFYVKATATLIDTESPEKIINVAFARESENKKGADEAQVTGGCVSYSSKYALNGLFCIDDTKDVDTDEYQNNGKKETKASAKKVVENKQDDAVEGKGAVVLAQIPPQTQVLNNKGQYVTLDSLSVEVLKQIKTMKMYEKAKADIEAVLHEKGAA